MDDDGPRRGWSCAVYFFQVHIAVHESFGISIAGRTVTITVSVSFHWTISRRWIHRERGNANQRVVGRLTINYHTAEFMLSSNLDTLFGGTGEFVSVAN